MTPGQLKAMTLGNNVASAAFLAFLIVRVESTLTVAVCLIGILVVKFGNLVEGFARGFKDGKESRDERI